MPFPPSPPLRRGPFRTRALLACLGAIALLPATSAAQDASRFRDPVDSAFDVSRHLASTSGFLPVPMIITEPAVGYGGGMFAMYFHGSIDEWSKLGHARGRWAGRTGGCSCGCSAPTGTRSTTTSC